MTPAGTVPTHMQEFDSNQSYGVCASPPLSLSMNPTLEEIFLFPGVELENEASETLGDITLNRTRYTLFIAADNVLPAVDLNLRYPQISGMVDKDTEHIINLMLFDIAFKSFGDSMTLINVPEALKLAQKYINQSHTDTSMVAEIDYKVINYTSPYLSLHFSGRNTAGNTKVNDFEYLVTINVETATYLNLTSYISMDDIKAVILEGDFEILAGEYSPGGWDAEEMAEQFVKALEEGLDEETLQEGHQLFSNRWDNGRSIQQICVNDKQYSYSEYDTLSSENFCFNKDSIFVRFEFLDSLDGYVLLEIPQNADKEN